MRRYKNGKTVFNADDMSVLSPNRDKSEPLTEGQRAFLESLVAAGGEIVPVEEGGAA